jgi:uncharacterized protein YjbJ (UPF0337 family)
MKGKNWTAKGIKDSAEGKATALKGKVKEAIGDATGDVGLKVEGKLDQVKGKAQDVVGKVERKI